jgi:hypothetical protein
MPIRVAPSTLQEEIKYQIDEAKVRAAWDDSGYLEAPPVQYGSHLVQCVIRVLTLRGMRVMTHDLRLDGRRSGFNAVVGKLRKEFQEEVKPVGSAVNGKRYG